MTENETENIKENSIQLPVGWRFVRLGDLCITGRGRVISQDYIKSHLGPYPVYSSQTKNDGVFGYIDSYDFEGDWITWTTDGANAGTVFFRQGKFNCTNVCGTVKPKNENVVNMRFLVYILNTLTPAHVNIAMGNPKLMNGVFEDIVIPLPQLGEQGRIVRILNEQKAAVEKARAATEAGLESAKALPAAYLMEVFESEEAKTWHRSLLGSYVIKIGSGLTPLGGYTIYLKSGVPLIRSQNVHMNHFSLEGLAFISQQINEEMSNSFVCPGDVLLNITGASIGHVCVVPSELCPANVNQHVCIIRCKENLNPQFLSFYLSTPIFQKFIMGTQAGATRQALTKTIIEQFEIPIIPIDEQLRLVTFLNDKIASAEKLIQAFSQELETINVLYEVFLRRAFSGGL